MENLSENFFSSQRKSNDRKKVKVKESQQKSNDINGIIELAGKLPAEGPDKFFTEIPVLASNIFIV